MQGRKNRSSLPSNYLTLAQLQERWLKQQSQTNEPQPHHEEPIQQPPPRNHPHHKLVAPTNATASRPQKHYVVKNRSVSQFQSPSTVVPSYFHRKSEAVAGIGGKTADSDTKANESKIKEMKNRKWNWISKAEERREIEEGSGTATQGGKDKEKTVIGSESQLSEKKSGGSDSVAKEEVVEQRVRVSSINSENGKQNGRLGKVSNGFRSQRKYHGGARYAYGNRNTKEGGANGKSSVRATHEDDKVEKTVIESELKEEKNSGGDGDSVTTEKVEQRVRVSSIKSENENDKQNGRLWKTNNGNRNRNVRHSKAFVQKTVEKMVWVRKDEN
ncbi:hypothetical protein VNO78_28906 [Psophocarpus tetragonolobus]|uniref:Uncharacterized protein n=1 Tax=Psophocarpus tetragonolobus TaxID=3891 RepID=A0AAN9WZL7_PSOTE